MSASKPVRRIERVRVELIEVGPGRRPIDPEAVNRLAESMEAIGQQSPISYRCVPLRPTDGVVEHLVLVTGGHRLAAAKQLGWDKIDAFEVDVDEQKARLHEIAENLHRAELSVLDRAEQISEWIRLTDKLAQVAPLSGGRGNEGGVRAAARGLGVDRTNAQRAVKVAGISAKAKDAARAAGIDDNRTALLKVAKEPTPAKQVAAVAEIASKRVVDVAKITADNKKRALREAASIIVDHMDPEYLDVLAANLRCCGGDRLAEAIATTKKGNPIIRPRKLTGA